MGSCIARLLRCFLLRLLFVCFFAFCCDCCSSASLVSVDFVCLLIIVHLFVFGSVLVCFFMAPSETTAVIPEANTATFSTYPVYYASTPSPLFTAPQGASPHFMLVTTLSPNSMHELSYGQQLLQGPPAPM
ncbi:hypothetical protein V6N12_023432 [Hibiscus sabdariffa]|uniref:Uncharacterized protein n=1 Tax=Hibiscus sabdariffa TaxID=183260 RepID=A0ABR2FXN9_9ROSI